MKYLFTLLKIFTVILFFVCSQITFSQVDSDAAVSNGQDSVSDIPPKDDDDYDCCEACPIGLPNLPSVTSINGLTVTVSIPHALSACPYYVQYDDGTGAPISLVPGTTSFTSTYATSGTYTICVSYISFCERGTCVVEHCFDVTVGEDPCTVCQPTPPDISIDFLIECDGYFSASGASYHYPCENPSYTWTVDGVQQQSSNSFFHHQFDSNGHYEVCVTFAVTNQGVNCPAEEVCIPVHITDCEDCEDCDIVPPFLNSLVTGCSAYICAHGESFAEPCHDSVYTWYVDGLEIDGETDNVLDYEFECNGVYVMCLDYAVLLGEEECSVDLACDTITITDCPCCEECNIVPPSLSVEVDGCFATVTSNDCNTEPCIESYTWFVDGDVINGDGFRLNYNFDCNGEYEVCLQYTVYIGDEICYTDEVCETVVITDCPCCDICEIHLCPIEVSGGHCCDYTFSAHTDFSDACHCPEYAWYIDGIFIDDTESLKYTFDCNGVYEVCLEFTVFTPDGEKCTEITCTTVVVDNCRDCVGGKRDFDENYSLISIYPNPASSYFNIDSYSENGYILNMYDLNGKVVRSDQHTGNASIQLSDEFAAGTYIIHIQGNDINHTEKIQIAK